MDDSSYLDLTHPEDGPERTAYFVLDSLLKSRIECGFESAAHRYGESVNVYLVHLLASLVRSPDLGGHTADRDIDVFHMIRASSDPRFKGLVYRANADHLLLSTGLFTDSPYVEREGRRTFDDSARDRIGRGKAYYHFASMFHERVRACSPVVAKVLGHLSEDFERYVDVLFHMRGEYFNLFERMREGQLASLRMPAGDDSPSLGTLRDGFLDAYWAWHERPTAASREALADAVARLAAVDPTFEFQLPEN